MSIAPVGPADLDSLPLELAVLDSKGQVMLCNASWRALADVLAPEESAWRAGGNFLRARSGPTAVAAAQLRIVTAFGCALQESKSPRSTSFSSGSGANLTWHFLEFRTSTLGEPGRILVAHTNITSAEGLNREPRAESVEERFGRLVARHTDRAIMILSPRGRIEWVNPGFTQLTGYSAEEAVGQTPDILHGPETDQKTSALIQQRVGSGLGADTEIIHYTKAGKPLWIRSELRPTRDCDGRLEYFVALEVDITEGKRHAEKLIAERNLLTTIINGLPQMIVWKDHHSTYRGCNERFVQAVGLSCPADIIGLTRDQVPALARQLSHHDDIDRQIVVTGIPVLRIRETFRLPSGEERIMSVSRLPLYPTSAAASGILFIGEDITEEEQIAQKIREDEERWTLALEANSVGVWDLDLTTKALTSSRRWSELLPEASGKHAVDSPIPAELVHPDDRPRYLSEWTALLGGLITTLGTVARVRIGKSFRFVVLRGRVAKRNDLGHALRAVGTLADIHEAKLSQMQAATATKLESIGQLAAGIAHEINTPTQYVGDNVRFLGDSFRQLMVLFDERVAALPAAASPRASIHGRIEDIDLPYLREEIPKAVAQSLEGIERIAMIVGAMKEFSHPGQDRTQTDINRAIASAITVATNEWKYVANIETEFDATLPHVPVFPGEFNQVILNIIVNAAHAIGESAAANSSTKGTIRVVTSHTDHELEVSISDNGCGMPRQIQERIFDPFFTTKPVGKGTGQGLAIAHNAIVQKHNGTLTVSSEVGRGTTFTITLPLEIASSAVAA